MSLKGRTSWWLRADAVVSWLLALPGLFDPASVAVFFGAEEPSYSFLVRLWCGLVFMFGWVSWEASRDPVAKAALVRYVWIEKAIVALTVLVGHLGGEAPPALMALVMLSNLPWIPALFVGERAARRGAAQTLET